MVIACPPDGARIVAGIGRQNSDRQEKRKSNY
jgi:hypothetical protein